MAQLLFFCRMEHLIVHCSNLLTSDLSSLSYGHILGYLLHSRVVPVYAAFGSTISDFLHVYIKYSTSL